MKKTINILTASVLCLSMISCSAPASSPTENAAGNTSAETAVEVSSEAPAEEDPAAEAPTEEAPAAENSSEEIDYTTGTPWMDVDLIGNVTADTPTDPKDNYALWANKDRILSFKIPEGYLSAGDLVDLTIQADADRKAMFHGPVPENHDAALAYDYYYLLTDWDSRDASGGQYAGGGSSLLSLETGSQTESGRSGQQHALFEKRCRFPQRSRGVS